MSNVDNTGRHLSRSKYLLLKAIPVCNYTGSMARKTIRRISSSVSRHSFLRRPPRAQSGSSICYAVDDSLAFSATSSAASDEAPDVSVISRTTSHASNQVHSALPRLDSLCAQSLPGSFILCPQINVTPELSVIDTNTCSIWVALEVRGVLRRADGYEEYGNGVDDPSHSSSQISGTSNTEI